MLYHFMSAPDVRAVLYALFRVRISPKGVCALAKKFPLDIPAPIIRYSLGGQILLFADEKYVWIKSLQAYWWSVRDHHGGVLASLITITRDAASAEMLLARAKMRIAGEMAAGIRDGLSSYDQPIRKVFGRHCRSIVAGIQGKGIMIDGTFHWLTNNAAESLNAQIDAYLAKVHYSFNSLESANHFVEMFLTRRNLRAMCASV